MSVCLSVRLSVKKWSKTVKKVSKHVKKVSKHGIQNRSVCPSVPLFVCRTKMSKTVKNVSKHVKKVSNPVKHFKKILTRVKTYQKRCSVFCNDCLTMLA